MALPKSRINAFGLCKFPDDAAASPRNPVEAYCEQNGNDSTAELGNPGRPFITGQAAFLALFAQLVEGGGGYTSGGLVLGFGDWSVDITAAGVDWPASMKVSGRLGASLYINGGGENGSTGAAGYTGADVTVGQANPGGEGGQGQNGNAGRNVTLYSDRIVEISVQIGGGNGGDGGQGGEGGFSSDDISGQGGDGGQGGNGGTGGNSGRFFLVNCKIGYVSARAGFYGAAGAGGNGGLSLSGNPGGGGTGGLDSAPGNGTNNAVSDSYIDQLATASPYTDDAVTMQGCIYSPANLQVSTLLNIGVDGVNNSTPSSNRIIY